MINQLNHYQALGLSQSASETDVRVAFRALALRFHPDKNDDKVTATSIFNRVYEAYLTLSNEETRKKYDMNLYMKTLHSNQTGGLNSLSFNLTAAEKEEFLRFKAFVNYAVFEEEVTDEEFAGIQPYFENKIMKTALSYMKNELSQERGLKKSENKTTASSSTFKRASVLKESVLNHASRKISKPPKPMINIPKKGTMRK